MIGEIHFVGDRVYVESNHKGTWESLPRLGFFRQLQLWLISTLSRRWTVEDTRRFCVSYGENPLKRRRQ